MARARNIKPGFFRNADLAELSVEVRLLFIGLWTLADREGRLEDRPRQIKMEIYPADQLDVDPMLDQLQANGFLVRYEVDGRRLIEVTNFIKHQDPHYKEKASELPPPPGKKDFFTASAITKGQRKRIMERDRYACKSCGSESALCIDHVIPVSRGGDSSDANLQVLCSGCNTKKGNKIGAEEKNSRRRRINVDPTSVQQNRSMPSDSLIPDSLIPEENTETAADAAPPAAPAGDSVTPEELNPKKPAGQCTFDTWVKRAEDAGTTPIPPGHYSRDYAEKVGLTFELTRLHWYCFRAYYRGSAKRYTDWGKVFLNSLKGNWFKLWAVNQAGEVFLTSAGKLAMVEHAESMQ